MLRIAVSVEGATEREFVSQVLAPYFLDLKKCLLPVDIKGNVSIDRVKGELKSLVYGFDFTTTLYDFYGFKKRGDRDVDQLENEIKSVVPTDRQEKFIPYIQLHEFETLLFSSPAVLAKHFNQPNKAALIAQVIKSCGGNIEAINDGFDTCPNQRVKKLFPAFNKKLDGPVICQSTGLDQLRKSSPRFHRWILQLEGI